MNWESKYSKWQILLWWLFPDKMPKCVSKWLYFLKDLHYVRDKICAEKGVRVNELDWRRWKNRLNKNLFFSLYVAQLFNNKFFRGGWGEESREGERIMGRTGPPQSPPLLPKHPWYNLCIDIIYALMTKRKPNMAGYWPRSSVVYWNPKKKVNKWR